MTKDKASVHGQQDFPQPARRWLRSGTPAAALALQRAAGNRAVASLLQSAVAPSRPPSSGLPAAVQSVLSGGSGEPLDDGARSEMEERFGEKFDSVRVHVDDAAAKSARTLAARAYTVGQHVVFGAGQFAPGTRVGSLLLAHELAHVVQQRRGGPRPDPNRTDTAIEMDANLAASQVAAASPVTVTGSSGVGVALDRNEDVAQAQHRISRAITELDSLKATVDEAKKKNTPLEPGQTARAYDQIVAAQKYARASKDAGLIAVVDKLKAQYDAIISGTPAARPASPFEPHPAASPDPLTAKEGARVVAEQRGSRAGLPAGHLVPKRVKKGEKPEMVPAAEELKRLEDSLKTAPSAEERKEIQEAIDALNRRVAISTPTLRDPAALAADRAKLATQLAGTGTAAEKARLQQQIAELDRQLAAVRAATAKPEVQPPLAAAQGGRLGHSGATFVTIQIVGKDGAILATVQASNDPARHAEIVLLERLEALPNKGRFEGATMTVFGDQEVCKKCTPAVRTFAAKYNFQAAYGDTENAPALTSKGELSGKDATAKTTIGKMSDPAAVDKLEQAQRRAGVIGEGDKLELAYKRRTLYVRPDSTGNIPAAKPPDLKTPAAPPKAAMTTPPAAASAPVQVKTSGPAAAPTMKPPDVKMPPVTAGPAKAPDVKAQPVKTPQLKAATGKMSFKSTVGASLKAGAAASALDFLSGWMKSAGAQIEIDRAIKRQIEALQPKFDELLQQNPRKIYANIHVYVWVIKHDVVTQQGVEEKSGFPMPTVSVGLNTKPIPETHESKSDDHGMWSIDETTSDYSVLLLDVEAAKEKEETERREALLREQGLDLADALKRQSPQQARGPQPPAAPQPPPAPTPEVRPLPTLQPPAPPTVIALPGAPPQTIKDSEWVSYAWNFYDYLLKKGRVLAAQQPRNADDVNAFASQVRYSRTWCKDRMTKLSDETQRQALDRTMRIFDEQMAQLGADLKIDWRKD